ncbi:MAG: hypothetical protein SWX82_01990 [Cyanobacteriota bacterium]|nr:hypothetical protein [Cyanobacteriota bacterium]
MNESRKKLLTKEAVDIIKWIFFPIAILLCGGILLLQGWILDPILVFAMFLLHTILAFLLIKTFLYNFVSNQKAFKIIQWILVLIFLPIAILLCMWRNFAFSGVEARYNIIFCYVFVN